MLYRQPKHIRPSNNQRQTHVQRVAPEYEQAARKRHMNAIEAAAFEVVYYSRIEAGVACTCSSMDPDPLNEVGEMSASTMSTILEGGDPDTDFASSNGIRVGVADYASDKKSYPVTEISKATIADDLIEDEDFVDDDDLDYHGMGLDNPSSEEVLNGYGATLPSYSSHASNCGVCNKTGFVGGFNRFGGFRKAWSFPNWVNNSNMANCLPKDGSIPIYMEIIGQQGSLEFVDVLPKDPYQVACIGLLNNHARFRMGVDWYLEVNGTPINHMGELKAFCTGQPVTFKIVSRLHFTHLEIELQLTPKPNYIDISNWDKVANIQSLNDYSDLQVNLPPTLLYPNRGDILFEKTSRCGWVVNNLDVIRSSNMSHGHPASITRILDRFTAFSVMNPYEAGAYQAPRNRQNPRIITRY